jgi:hypothetical protein
MVGEISWNDANMYRSWIRGCNGTPCAGCKNIVDPINLTRYNGTDYFNDVSFGSEHPGGALFVRGDASVDFESETIDMVVYRALASRDGGEPMAQ